jgi:low affinity Fe/Cu permease
MVLTKLGVFASHPIAFIIVFCYVAAWLALSPESFDWHAVATVATWFMTLIIQRAEHRDTQAIHVIPNCVLGIYNFWKDHHDRRRPRPRRDQRPRR